MRTLLFALPLVFFLSCDNQAQAQYQPEDIIHSAGDFDMKYKHVMAYVDMEMEGEDPNLLNDQKYMAELTKEAIEEFSDDPESFIADMDQHYEAILAGAGNLANTALQQAGTQSNQVNQSNTTDTGTGAAANSQWGQILSGSILYYTATQHYEGMTVQTTQLMHLCPNGAMHLYETSGGGGGAITDPRQTQYTGSANWRLVEQGGQTYFQITMDGVTRNLALGIINQKVQIEALGVFSVDRGSAQCQ